MLDALNFNQLKKTFGTVHRPTTVVENVYEFVILYKHSIHFLFY